MSMAHGGSVIPAFLPFSCFLLPTHPQLPQPPESGCQLSDHVDRLLPLAREEKRIQRRHVT